jgi:hypothetical protein
MSDLIAMIDHVKVATGDFLPVIKSLLSRGLTSADAHKSFMEYDIEVLHLDLEGGNDDYTYNQYRLYNIMRYIEGCAVKSDIYKLSRHKLWTVNNTYHLDRFSDKIIFKGKPEDEHIEAMIEYSQYLSLEQYQCLGI